MTSTSKSVSKAHIDAEESANVAYVTALARLKREKWQEALTLCGHVVAKKGTVPYLRTRAAYEVLYPPAYIAMCETTEPKFYAWAVVAFALSGGLYIPMNSVNYGVVSAAWQKVKEGDSKLFESLKSRCTEMLMLQCNKQNAIDAADEASANVPVDGKLAREDEIEDIDEEEEGIASDVSEGEAKRVADSKRVKMAVPSTPVCPKKPSKTQVKPKQKRFNAME